MGKAGLDGVIGGYLQQNRSIDMETAEEQVQCRGWNPA